MTFAALWLECTPSTSSIPAPRARTGSYYVPQRHVFGPRSPPSGTPGKSEMVLVGVGDRKLDNCHFAYS